MTIADVLIKHGLVKSHGEARRVAAQGGVSVNGVKTNDVDQSPPVGDVKIRVGKSRSVLIEVAP